MCEPASITAGVMALAGTAATMARRNSQKKSRDKATRNELDRQDSISKKARNRANETIDLFKPEKQIEKKAEVADARTKTIQGNISNEGTYAAPTAGSAPKVVQTQLTKSIADALDYGRTRAASLGQLGAWGDTSRNNAFALARSGSDLDTLGGFAGGSAGVLPLELADANQSGEGFAYLGDGLKAGGQFANAYGARNDVGWNDIFSSTNAPRSPQFGPYGKNGMRPY